LKLFIVVFFCLYSWISYSFSTCTKEITFDANIDDYGPILEKDILDVIPKGGTICLGQGVFPLKTGVRVPLKAVNQSNNDTGLILIGTGYKGTQLLWLGDGIALDFDSLWNSSFEKFSIKGRGANTGAGIKVGIDTREYPMGDKIKDVASTMLKFSDLMIREVEAGIILYDEADQAILTGNYFFDVSYGFRGLTDAHGIANVVMIGNHFQGVQKRGVDVKGGSGFVLHGNVFQGADLGMNGMVFDNFDTLSIIGNYFEATRGTTGVFINLGPKKMGAGGMSGADIRSNHIDFGNSPSSSAATAILINYAKGVSISNNSFYGQGFTAIKLSENTEGVQIGPNVYSKEIDPKKRIVTPPTIQNLIILGD
jgi:hypothetical protein